MEGKGTETIVEPDCELPRANLNNACKAHEIQELLYKENFTCDILQNVQEIKKWAVQNSNL